LDEAGIGVAGKRGAHDISTSRFRLALRVVVRHIESEVRAVAAPADPSRHTASCSDADQETRVLMTGDRPQR